MGWEEYNIKVDWITPDEVRKKYEEYNKSFTSNGGLPISTILFVGANVYPTKDGCYMVTYDIQTNKEEGVFTNSKNKIVLRYKKLRRILR